MGTLRDLKKRMRKDEELKPMLVHSTLHELLIDVDGDSLADIALIDNTHDGDIDTVAIDLTGSGDFNLYIGDSDANGVIDTVTFYDDFDPMPIASYYGRNVEQHFIDLGTTLYNVLTAADFITAEVEAALNEFEAKAKEIYESEMQKAEQDKTEE